MGQYFEGQKTLPTKGKEVKSAEEWQNSGNGGLSASLSFIRRVQADALRHAAEIVSRCAVEALKVGLTPNYVAAIYAEAQKLEGKQ